MFAHVSNDECDGRAGKVVLVTGAASGIGAGVATELADEGYRVALVDRDEAGVRRVTGELASEGLTAEAFTCDVSDQQDVARTVESIDARLGSVDILVNNAGFTRDAHLLEMRQSDWDDIIATHLRGTYMLTRAVAEPMASRGWDRIVNISSISALGDTERVNYVAAKAGIEGFTRAAALDLAAAGITVNAIGPGVIQTAITEVSARRAGRSLAEHLVHQAEGIPVGRVGQPHDIARAVRFFIAEDADFITGQVLYVSGGPHG